MAETPKSAPRRDPDGGGGVTNQDIRVPRDPATVSDEPVNRGRREAHIAGGNGEQLSRERARTKSEPKTDDDDPKPFQRPIDPPSPRQETPGIDPARKGEPAIRASGHDAPSTTGAKR